MQSKVYRPTIRLRKQSTDDDDSTVYYSEWAHKHQPHSSSSSSHPSTISTNHCNTTKTTSAALLDSNTIAMYLFVIAHPDDETLFFLPTLCNLLFSSSPNEEKTCIHLSILCLSTGNYNQVGHVRIEELYQVVDSLVQTIMEGDRSKDSSSCISLTIVDHNQLPDHPTHRWSHTLIANILEDHIHKQCIQILDKQSVKNSSSKGSTKRIQVNILSFDQHGVSGHVNHIDTFYGVSTFIHLLDVRQQEQSKVSSSPIQVHLKWMLLQSIYKNPIRKYFPILEWMYFLWIHVYPMISTNDSSSPSSLIHPFLYQQQYHGAKQWTCFMYRPRLNWKLMALHQSQFVWYRRLFILFSAYTFVNTWTLVYDQEVFLSSRQ